MSGRTSAIFAIYVKVYRPFAELSTDGAETTCDADYLVFRVMQKLLERDPLLRGRTADKWRRAADARGALLKYGERRVQFHPRQEVWI